MPLDVAKFWDPPLLFYDPMMECPSRRESDDGQRSRHSFKDEKFEFAEKKVGWIELFFDLSAAFCISTLSSTWISELDDPTDDLPFDIPWNQLIRIITVISGALLVKLWMLEMNYRSIFDGDNDIYGRFLTILQMLNIGAMFEHVSELYSSFDSNLYSLLTAYFWQYIFLCLKIIRAMYYNKRARFVCGASLAHIGLDLLCVGLMATGGPMDDNRWRFVFICVCPWWNYIIFGILRYFTKWHKAPLSEQIIPNPAYVTERFGLLMLLVFGELLLEANNFASRSFSDHISFINENEMLAWHVGLNIFAIFWLYLDNMQPPEVCFGFFRRQLVAILHTLLVCSLIAMGGILEQCFEYWDSNPSKHSIGSEETWEVIIIISVTMFLLFCLHAAIHFRHINFIMMLLTTVFGVFLALLSPNLVIILHIQAAFSYFLIFLDVYYRQETNNRIQSLVTRLLTNLGIREEPSEEVGERVVYVPLLEQDPSKNNLREELEFSEGGENAPMFHRSFSDPVKFGEESYSRSSEDLKEYKGPSRSCNAVRKHNQRKISMQAMAFKEPTTHQQPKPSLSDKKGSAASVREEEKLDVTSSNPFRMPSNLD